MMIIKKSILIIKKRNFPWKYDTFLNLIDCFFFQIKNFVLAHYNDNIIC